jgi:hypothetical protein
MVSGMFGVKVSLKKCASLSYLILSYRLPRYWDPPFDHRLVSRARHLARQCGRKNDRKKGTANYENAESIPHVTKATHSQGLLLVRVKGVPFRYPGPFLEGICIRGHVFAVFT